MRKSRKNKSEIIGKAIAIIGLVIMLWGVISWAEVLVHSGDSLDGEPYEYSNYNLIQLVFGNLE